MRVLGVDPGVSETGWAILEGGKAKNVRLLYSGLIRTSPRTPLPDRLRAIHDGLDSLIREHRPEAMAVEQMFFMKAANTVRATLQARGVVLLAASRNRTPVQEYNPRQVKVSLTGSGAAPKVQMQRMVQSALGLSERLRPDDVADAAAIAICHLRSSRMKRLVVLDRIGGSHPHPSPASKGERGESLRHPSPASKGERGESLRHPSPASKGERGGKG